MKKQFLSLGVAAAVSASLLAGCGSSASNTAASTAGSAASEAASTASTETAAAASTSAAAEETASAEAVDPSSMKIGMICVGDEAVTYDKAHIDGITAAAGKVGIGTDQIVFKKNVPEDATAYDAAVELVESQGCNLVISDSYGHQNFMVQAAEEYPDVQFVSMTGDFAALSGLDNFHNAFDNIYEARYVSGVVAGMKVQQLVDDGKLTDDNYDKDGKVKIGYVGAFNYAEVVSGYTAFYNVMELLCYRHLYTKLTRQLINGFCRMYAFDHHADVFYGICRSFAFSYEYSAAPVSTVHARACYNKIAESSQAHECKPVSAHSLAHARHFSQSSCHERSFSVVSVSHSVRNSCGKSYYVLKCSAYFHSCYIIIRINAH